MFLIEHTNLGGQALLPDYICQLKTLTHNRAGFLRATSLNLPILHILTLSPQHTQANINNTTNYTLIAYIYIEYSNSILLHTLKDLNFPTKNTLDGIFFDATQVCPDYLEFLYFPS